MRYNYNSTSEICNRPMHRVTVATTGVFRGSEQVTPRCVIWPSRLS